MSAEKNSPIPTVKSPATEPDRKAISSAFLLLVNAAAATLAFALTAMIMPAYPEK